MQKSFMPRAGRSIDAAQALGFQKRKTESVGDWCNKKGIPSAYFRLTATCQNASEVFSPGTVKGKG